MNAKTTRALDRLEADTKELLTYLNRYDHQALNSNPKPNTFSALQNLEHLMKSELMSQQYVQKKLSFEPRLKKAGLLTGLRLGWMRVGNRLPIKLKAPKFIAQESLPAESEFYEIVKRWRDQRTALRTYLDELPEELHDKEIFKHPFAGRMTLYGMVVFFRDHLHRHKKQIRRALAGYR